MPEPLTTVGVGAIAAYLGKDGLTKLLGPTADYLGHELKEFAQKRINNVGNIFKNAQDKLGDRIDKSGAIPPKVLKTIMNEGSYSDDEIAVEYFGGVLASSRSDVLRDDRGARIAKAVDNLSSYQLRCHYLIYSTISNVLKGQKYSFHQGDDRAKLEIFMPLQEFANAMKVSQEEWDNPQLQLHIFGGLEADGLIMGNWGIGPADSLKKVSGSEKIEGRGVVCTPTITGAELFLWGFGCGNHRIDYIFDSEFDSEIKGMPMQVKNSCTPKT
jgi:hypothetical protein